MKHGKGILTERSKYVATMAALLADRAEMYESEVDRQLEETGYFSVYEGYHVGKEESGTNLSRMIVQLRLELLEVGKMIGSQQ